MSKYDDLVNKIKKNLGTDNIVVSVTPTSIIVDRTDRLECVVEIGNMYNAPYIVTGTNMVTDITCEDLENFGILTPIPNADKPSTLDEPFSYKIQMPKIVRWGGIPVTVLELSCRKRHKSKLKRHINDRRKARYKRYLKSHNKAFKSLSISYKEDESKSVFDYMNIWVNELNKHDGEKNEKS